MKIKTPTVNALAACLFPLDKPGTTTAIQLFPAGEFDAPDGSLAGTGPWRLDAESAARLIAATSTTKNMLIDYDHQSLLFTKNLQPLEAAGTFAGAELEWREGVGLFATNVSWTAASAAHFAANDYRFISPLFTYDAASGEVTRLISVALTNTPAIKNMAAIELAAASFLSNESPFNPKPKEIVMNKDLLALLGLPEAADQAAVLAACTALKKAGEQVAALSAQVDTLQAQAPDVSKYVPVAVVTELQTQLAALSTDIETDKVKQLVADNASKLPTPGLQAWAAKQSLAALTAYLETAPEIAALSGMQSQGKPPADDVQMDDTNALVAAAAKYQTEQQAVGIDVDDIAALTHVKGIKNV